MSVVINAQNIVATNQLSLDFQCDWGRWVDLRNGTIKGYATEFNPKIIRNFDFRGTKPCTQWNEATKTGTWNWANIDEFTDIVFSMGAEPLFTLGWAAATATQTQTYIPSGMAINSATGLPYPDSWAAYCREWVKHFKQTGRPVRFYETMNEPFAYWGWADFTKMGYFRDLFNAASVAMRAENPNVLVSFDSINRRPVMDWWLLNGGALDFLSFHKYDEGTINGYTDDQMLNRGETFQLNTDTAYYGVQDTRQKYFNARGVSLPVIMSEGNFSSAWSTGTEPRMQQIVGGIWLALNLRQSILVGLNATIYFELTSNKTWELANKTSGGWGFGMIDNGSSMTRWIPYYVYLIFGKNLFIDDPIIESTTNDPDLRTIAWIHQGTINVILINKSHNNKQVSVTGMGANLDYTKIDESANVANPALQTGVYPSSNIVLNGYTVMLLQAPNVQTKFTFSHWQDGDTNPIKTVVL